MATAACGASRKTQAARPEARHCMSRKPKTQRSRKALRVGRVESEWKLGGAGVDCGGVSIFPDQFLACGIRSGIGTGVSTRGTSREVVFPFNKTEFAHVLGQVFCC